MSHLEEKLDEARIADATVAAVNKTVSTSGRSDEVLQANQRDRRMVDQQFTYQRPHDDQADRYEALRDAAKTLAHTIISLVPPCADRTAALRKLREVVFTANAGIALEGLTHPDRAGLLVMEPMVPVPTTSKEEGLIKKGLVATMAEAAKRHAERFPEDK